MKTKVLSNKAEHSALLAEQAAVLEAATPALRQKIQSFRARVTKQIQDTLDFYRLLGKELVEIDDNKDGKYGDKPLDTVATLLQRSISTLAHARQFYLAYTDDEYKALVDKNAASANEGGGQLHWGHVSHLIGIADKRRRSSLEDKAIDEAWTTDLLHDQIKKALNGPRGKGGRPLNRPGTLAGLLHQWRSKTGEWLTRNRDVWRKSDSDVVAQLINLPPDNYTAEMLGELQQIQAALAEMSQVAQTDYQAMSRAIERVQRVVTGSKPAPAAASKKSSTASTRSAVKSAAKTAAAAAAANSKKKRVGK